MRSSPLLACPGAGRLEHRCSRSASVRVRGPWCPGCRAGVEVADHRTSRGPRLGRMTPDASSLRRSSGVRPFLMHMEVSGRNGSPGPTVDALNIPRMVSSCRQARLAAVAGGAVGRGACHLGQCEDFRFIVSEAGLLHGRQPGGERLRVTQTRRCHGLGPSQVVPVRGPVWSRRWGGFSHDLRGWIRHGRGDCLRRWNGCCWLWCRLGHFSWGGDCRGLRVGCRVTTGSGDKNGRRHQERGGQAHSRPPRMWVRTPD